MDKKGKKEKVSELSGKLKDLQSIMITDYKGLSVKEVTELRKKLREKKSAYYVIKNTLARLSFKEMGLSDLVGQLKGTTGIATTNADPVSCAKELVEFRKQHVNLKIRGGWLTGKVLDTQAIESLATLPSRKVLLAQVVGGISSPLFGMVYVLNGTLTGLVRALGQIRDRKQSVS